MAALDEPLSKKKHDQQAIQKLFLSLVPHLLEVEHQTSNASFSTDFHERNARRQRSERQIRRRLQSRVSKMRSMYIPFKLTNGLTLTAGDDLTAERRVWARERSSMWWDVVVKDHWTDQDWIENFRMTKATFTYICEKVRDKITYHNTNMRRALPVEQRLAITIWRLATNCGYRIIGDLFGVGVSTVCTIIQQTCKALASSMQQEFLVLPTKEKLQAIVDGFMNDYGFPQVGGCIGTCYIPIKRPDSNNAQEYITAEGNPAVILQGIVDNKGQFLDVSAGWPGSTSEVQILQQSHFYESIRNGTLFQASSLEIEGESVPVVLLGGVGYPLQKNLMKPFDAEGSALTDSQHVFNQQMNRGLSVAASAFERLKRRWHVLQEKNENKVVFIPDIVATCCILHNLCEQRGEPSPIPPQEPQQGRPLILPCQESDPSAERTRHALASYFLKRLGNMQHL